MMSGPSDALALTGISKAFGATRALDGANLHVRRGSIHGLIGQNGAGKSTIIKILGGLYRPDAGRIDIGGEAMTSLTPRALAARGVGIIHQEALLPPGLTVAEALFLRCEPRVGPLLARRRMRRRAEELIGDCFAIRVAGDAIVGDLSPAERQVVQITRALVDRPRVLVFDEPTAALVRQEACRLFDIIGRLRGEGTSVVYVSHYLEEVRDLCDRVTVLRNGRDVATVDARTTPVADMIGLMIDRTMTDMFPPRPAGTGRPVLAMRSLARRSAYQDVDLTVHAGEIVGLTGLVGSGAKEVLQTAFGLTNPHHGSIALHGRTSVINSPVRAVARRLGLVPEDRRHQGIALDISVRENATLASLGGLTRLGMIDRRRERDQVLALIERLGIRTPGTETPLRDLSGGNQQKVVLAKWLSARSDVFLLDEPTVGVDVGAKVEIYRLLGELAARGAAILVLSSDLIELRGLCDRVLVMYRGRIVRQFEPDITTTDDMLEAVTTGRSRAAA